MSVPPPRVPELRAPPKAKIPWFSRKNLALLREEQTEPRQIHLLLVRLNLGKIGVHRDVGHQTLGDAVLHIEPQVPGDVVRELQSLRSVFPATSEIAYGFSSIVRSLAGTSRPTSVADSDIMNWAGKPRAAGRGVSDDISFFHRTTRRMLKPQIWARPCR